MILLPKRRRLILPSRQRGFLINPYSHGGSPPGDADPFFANVVALLQVEDTIEEIIGVATVSLVGSTAISTDTAIFGAKSISSPGAGQNSAGVRLQGPDDYFVFAGQFTFEGWFYPTNFTNWRSLFDGQRDYPAAGSWTLQSSSTGGLTWILNGNFSTGPGAPSVQTINAWQHIAITRDGANDTRLFVGGVLLATATHAGTVGGEDTDLSFFNISRGIAGDNGSFQGYFEEIRVTKGVCRYTATFTPPSAPFPTFGP